MFGTVRTFIPHIRGIQRSWEPVNTATQLQFQQVRWRKRRTDPKAKSKIGRVKPPQPVDPWEKAFFREKLPHYSTTLSAMRRLFSEELERKKDETAEGLSSIEQEKEEEEEFRQLLIWNEAENAKVAVRREEKLAAKARQLEEEKLERLIERDAAEAKEIQQLTELVRKEKEASKTFITREAIEAAIEEALDSPKNYNFLIKKSGAPILPQDSAWDQFRQRTLQEQEQELVEKGEDESKAKSAEN